MPINYDDLERAARACLEGPLTRLDGALQVWTMFVGAHEIGNEFLNSRREMSVWAKHAFTLAMVVEYSKPWSGNREPAVAALDKSFLDAVVADPRHDELREYRNQGAAHLDRGVQPLGVTIQGVVVRNDVALARRFPHVCVPVRARADVGIALGLNSDADIGALVEHIEAAVRATVHEVRDAAHAVQEVARDHAPVLDRLDDLVRFDAATATAPGEHRMPDTVGGRVPTPERTLTIHNRTFTQVALVWESTSPSGDNVSVRRDGFELRSQRQADDRVGYNLTFYDVQDAWIE